MGDGGDICMTVIKGVCRCYLVMGIGGYYLTVKEEGCTVYL